MAGKRRSNGEGSFYQLPNKTWVHQITIGRKPDGSLERKAFKGRTKAICIQRKEAWLAQEKEKAELEASAQTEAERNAQERMQLGHSVESETLFSEAFLQWLKLYKAPPTRKASTYATYLALYEDHFARAFGDKPLYQITQDMIQDYYQKKQLNGARKDGRPGGLSPKTIRNHHMILKDFFSYAQTKYQLACNPTLQTTRPEVVNRETRVLSADEMQIFIGEVMKESQRIAILTDLFTGMRIGELLALTIDDLNLERQSLRVSKNLIRVSTQALSLDNPTIQILDYNPEKRTHLIIQDTPKSKSSNREIFISDGLCELLVRHLFTLAHSSWPNPNNLLFPSRKGTYIDPKSFEIRLNAVSKRCTIKKVNPHALCHTFATRLVEENTPLNIIKDILGHASISTTQRYMHGSEENERTAISTMSSYLDIEKLSQAPRLKGAKKQPKFAGLVLPDFSKQPRKPTA